MTDSDSSRHEFDIVIASPNAAVDSYYPLQQLEVGTVNRSEHALHTAGGKGNNMARAAARLGARVLSLGIVGGVPVSSLYAISNKRGSRSIWSGHRTKPDAV